MAGNQTDSMECFFKKKKKNVPNKVVFTGDKRTLNHKPNMDSSPGLPGEDHAISDKPLIFPEFKCSNLEKGNHHKIGPGHRTVPLGDS